MASTRPSQAGMEGNEETAFIMEETTAPRRLYRVCLKNIFCFTANFSIICLLLETLRAYTVSQITALEKQFGLSSTRSGLLLSCSEIGFLCAIFFFSHFGGKRHIPRILAGAGALYGIAGIGAGLLNFANPITLPDIAHVHSNLSSSSGRLCQNSSDGTLDPCATSEDHSADLSSSQTEWIFVMLAVAMVITGIGKSPRFSLGFSFVDTNSRDKPQSSLLVGVILTVTFFGGSVAFYVGGLFSSVPVDLSDVNLDPLHPEWIGAWWIGYLLFGSIAVLVAIPLYFFPKHIKTRPDRDSIHKPASFLDEVKDLPKSVIRVLRNPVVSFLLAANCCILVYVGGSLPFSPKYIQNQFTVPAYKVNFIVGTEELLWAVGGTLAGGILTSKLKLTNRGCVTLIVIVSSVASAIYSCAIGLGCDNPHIRGIGESRYNMSSISMCECDAEEFFPVCGADNVTYSSPCTAGCRSQNASSYSDCSEIPGGGATAGQCNRDCPYLIPYVAVDLISGLSGTVSLVPVVMTIIKLVEPRDKSMAVALSSFLNGLFGFLPGPLLYGSVIDSTCILWEKTCDKRGACALYDLPELRYRMKGMDLGFYLTATCLYIMAFLMFRLGIVSDKTLE